MHSNLQIACLVHVHSSAILSQQELAELLADVCVPLLDVIEQGSVVPLNLHFSGPILEHAARHEPSFLMRLKHAVRAGRVEVVGGPFYDAVLPTIPARDALGQMLFLSNFQEEHLAGRPRGAWLSLSAWDSSLIAPLRDAGFSWTLVDGEAFEAVGIQAWDVHGHFSTERHGRGISLFPIDDDLSRAAHELDPEALAAKFKRVASRPQAPTLVSLVLDGEHLVRSEHHAALLSCLRSNVHWLKGRLFSSAHESLDSRGRVYLGQSAWPALAPWCRPAEPLASSAMEGAGAPVVWENSLARYSEANRIHKRMLRVSERVDRLRKVLARQHKKGKNIHAAKKLMEKACTHLWKAQGHDVYWHGGGLHFGIYDPQLRAAILRGLLAAEKIVHRLLGGRDPSAWEEVVADHDGDGEAELLVRTRSLQALLDGPSGGGLSELDLLLPGVALMSCFDPILEPYHEVRSGTEIQLVSEGEGEPEEAESPAASGLVPAMDRLAIGKYRRGAFLDHFLGPETSIGSFSRGQYRELGDFASGAFELVAPLGGASDGQVTLGRSGLVADGEGNALIRVEKTFQFDLEHPRLTLRHRISNRSRDPSSSWFGLEWTFGIPSGGLEGVTLRAQGGEGLTTLRLDDGPVEIPATTWLEWEDAGSGMAFVIELDTPQSIWWLPVSTVAKSPHGWREDVQGNSLLFHSPTEIWGNEDRRMELRVSFHSEET